MNSTTTADKPHRHVWRWVMLGVGLCLAPFVILAIVAFSFVTLDRDAAILRKHVMAATDNGWDTKVQLSVGRITLAAVRAGLAFVHHQDIADARLALAAIRHASIGVYARTPGGAAWSRQQLFAEADQAMQKRHWTRLVGVSDHKDTVLIYMPQDFDADDPVEICLAVVNDKELVVVSTRLDAAVLAELVARHSPEEMKSRLHLAKLQR